MERTSERSECLNRLNNELTELTLLVPSCWLTALEDQAADLDLTVAQLVRRLIRNSLPR